MARRSAARLCPDLVFGAKVFDDLLLLAIDRASDAGKENQPWLQDAWATRPEGTRASRAPFYLVRGHRSVTDAG
jgi:hypothetical protein